MINKVLITSEELQELLTCADMNIRALAGEIAKRHCEQPRFSVLEWHNWGSIPEAESIILVQYKDRIEIDVVHYENDWWYLGNGSPESAIAWAYLPE